MKVSKLIDKLQDVQDRMGDVEVLMTDGSGAKNWDTLVDANSVFCSGFPGIPIVIEPGIKRLDVSSQGNKVEP